MNCKYIVGNVAKSIVIFFILIFAFASMAKAQVGYAVLTDNDDLEGKGKTLTFESGDAVPNGALELNIFYRAPWSSQCTKITNIVFEPSFKKCYPSLLLGWFDDMQNLTNITGMKDYLNTDDITDMGSRFYNCQKLSELDLSGFKTSNVTNMEGMFDWCLNLTNIKFGDNFNTGSVQQMNWMFFKCEKLTTLDLRSFDTRNVTNMSDMFGDCNNLTAILVGDNWSTDQVTISEGMFTNCPSLIGNGGEWVTSTDAINANTSSTGYLTKDNYKVFLDLDGGTLEDGTVINLIDDETTLPIPTKQGAAFLGWQRQLTASTYEPTVQIEVKVKKNEGNKKYKAQWGVGYAELSNNENGKTLTFKSGGTIPGGAMALNTGEESPAWNSLDKSEITQVAFDETFQYARPTSCYQWFSGFVNLSDIKNIQYLHTDDVTTMKYMFYSCKRLKKLDLRTFNTENVEDMDNLFNQCYELTVLDLRSFNTQKAKTALWSNHNHLEDMFNNCQKLTTILIGNDWDAGENNYNSDMFLYNYELIGNDGTLYDLTDGNRSAEYANADAGGYLTKDNYKIFYLWADEYITTYHTHSPSSFDGNSAVTLEKPEREGYELQYWERISANGNAIGDPSTTVTIAAGDVGNRIYKAYWKLKAPLPAILPAEDLVYNGTKQNLITLESTIPSGITVKYRVDDGAYATTLPIATDAKDYVVWYKVDETEKYAAVTETSLSVTISPKPLTITANSQTIDYAASIPNFTATYSGFVGDENESALTGTLTFDCAYNPSSESGSYDITPKGLSSNNYDIKFVKGILTVNPNPNPETEPEPITLPNKIEIDKESIVQEDIDPELYCVNGDGTVKLKFKTISGNITGYSLTVENNVVEPQSGTIDVGDSRINVIIPSDIKPGYYSGQIVFTDGTVETDPYNFTLKINMVKGVIKLLYRNVMFVDNHDTLFSEYQWVKNDVDIPNARKQYYTEPEFAGSYKCKMKTRVGIDVLACPFEQNVSAKALKANVVVYPNPAVANQRFTLQIINYNPDNKYEIYITNSTGNIVKSITNAQQTNTIELPMGHFIGALICNGEKSGFKVLVE